MLPLDSIDVGLDDLVFLGSLEELLLLFILRRVEEIDLGLFNLALGDHPLDELSVVASDQVRLVPICLYLNPIKLLRPIELLAIAGVVV